MSHFVSTRGIVIKHLKAFCICRKFTNETFPRNNKPNSIPSLKKDLAELAHSLRTSEVTMIWSSMNDDNDTSTGSVDLTNVDNINTLDKAVPSRAGNWKFILPPFSPNYPGIQWLCKSNFVQKRLSYTRNLFYFQESALIIP